MEKQLTITQAAQIAGMNRASIWKVIKRGELIAVLTPTPFNRDVFMIDAEQFYRWLAARSSHKKGEINKT